MNVLISTTTFAEHNKKPLDILKKNGINHTLNPYKRKLNEAEIYELLFKNSYQGLVAGTEPLTKKVLTEAKNLKIISRVGKGLDNIDLETAENLKIKVYNTSEGLADAVSELTVGLILSSLRKITLMDRNMRNHVWEKKMGSLFKGKTLGIIGFGDIGQKVAQIADNFGVKIIYHDIVSRSSGEFRQVSLKELLESSDIITLHSSSKDRLIKTEELNQMKKGVIIVNTARGSLIDEDALYQALISGKIAFAALDVYNKEPYSGKLLELDNVICTPHIGSYAKEARVRMEIKAVENLIEGLKEVKLL